MLEEWQKRGVGGAEGQTIHSFTDFPCSFALCINVGKVTKRRSEGWNNPFIQRLPFPLKRCLPLHPSSAPSFQEPFGKMDLNKKVCAHLYTHENRACAACSLLWMLGYNMDIPWRSEDQHVNHINYTPTWKHRWSSNKEKSAGFTGNLNHIFL